MFKVWPLEGVLTSMATATINVVDAQSLIRARLLDRTPERTPGIHISDVIADLIECVPSLANKLDLNADTRDAMFTLGLGWEDAVVAYVGWGPMQIVHEGITLSADSVDVVESRIHEAKCTWKSQWGFEILDQWRWMTQVKGYCWGYEMRTASLWALHLNGDYRPPSPVVVRYDLEFTMEELAENWFMLKQHAALMVREGRGK